MTGATGFIGGHVTRQLVEVGQQVTAIVRDPSKAVALSALGVRVVAGDITDPASLRRPMEGVDGVFHVAGWYKVGARDPRPARRINVDGTHNVLAAMRDLGIPKGVYTSTLAVYSDTRGQLVDESYRHNGPWLSEYDRTKWQAHFEVAESMIADGLPLVIVLPGMVYGPGDTSSLRDSLLQFLRRRLLITPARTAFCWSHVDDTARAHLLAMERGRPGETYIIAGPPHPLANFFATAEHVTGVRAPRWHPSPTTMRALAAVMAAVGRVVPLPEAYTGEALRVIAGVTYLGSNEKARRELGFAPRPLEQGLRETLLPEMTELGMMLPAHVRGGE